MTNENDIESSPYSYTGNRMHAAYQKAANEDTSALSPPSHEDGTPLTPEEYEEQFLQDSDYLRMQELLPEILLKKHLRNLLRRRNKLKYEFRHGTTLTLAVVPTSDIGLNFTEEELRNGTYFVAMTVEENDATDSALSMRAGPFVQVVPDRPREECSLPIVYENGLNPNVTEADFKKIYDFHIDSFNAWRRFFGLEEMKTIPYFQSPPQNQT